MSDSKDKNTCTIPWLSQFVAPTRSHKQHIDHRLLSYVFCQRTNTQQKHCRVFPLKVNGLLSMSCSVKSAGQSRLILSPTQRRYRWCHPHVAPAELKGLSAPIRDRCVGWRVAGARGGEGDVTDPSTPPLLCSSPVPVRHTQSRATRPVDLVPPSNKSRQSDSQPSSLCQQRHRHAVIGPAPNDGPGGTVNCPPIVHRPARLLTGGGCLWALNVSTTAARSIRGHRVDQLKQTPQFIDLPIGCLSATIGYFLI